MQKTIKNKIIRIDKLSSKNLIADNNWQITVTRKSNKNRKQQIIIHNIHLLKRAIYEGLFCTVAGARKLSSQEQLDNYFSSNVLVCYILSEKGNIIQRVTQRRHYNMIAKIALKYFEMFEIL